MQKNVWKKSLKSHWKIQKSFKKQFMMIRITKIIICRFFGYHNRNAVFFRITMQKLTTTRNGPTRNGFAIWPAHSIGFFVLNPKMHIKICRVISQNSRKHAFPDFVWNGPHNERICDLTSALDRIFRTESENALKFRFCLHGSYKTITWKIINKKQ